MPLANPYRPPDAIPPIAAWKWRAIGVYLASGFVFGFLVGSALMFAFSLVFVIPPWGPSLYKGDERWGTVFFVAGTMLPIAISACSALALVILRFISVHLRHREAAICLVLTLFFVGSLRPVVSRVHRPGYTPLFELVPDTILRLVAVVLLATVFSGVVHWLRQRSATHTGTASQPPS